MNTQYIINIVEKMAIQINVLIKYQIENEEIGE